MALKMSFVFLTLFLSSLECSIIRNQKKEEIGPSNRNYTSDAQKANSSCGDCEIFIKDLEGIINTLDYPQNYSYQLSKKWTIQVPEDHDIFLSFSKQSENSSNTFACESCKPYVEIIYGHRSEASHHMVYARYDIAELQNVSIPHYKTEIRYFSNLLWGKNKTQVFENSGLNIFFKAIPIEETWSIYMILSAVISLLIIILGVGCFYVILKKKGAHGNFNESQILPVTIFNDEINCPIKVSKCLMEGKENRILGLRLRTRNSSELKDPTMVNEISSLVDSAEYTTLPDSFATPPLLNSSATDGAQKGVFKKKLQPKVLMNRYSRSISSTPRNGRIQEKGKRLLKFSKSDTTHDQRRGESNKENQMFDFYSQLGKEDPTPQPEADISVFLSTPDSSSENE